MFSTGPCLRQYVKLAYRLCNATERQASRYNQMPQELVSLREFKSSVESSPPQQVRSLPMSITCTDISHEMPKQSYAGVLASAASSVRNGGLSRNGVLLAAALFGVPAAAYGGSQLWALHHVM